MPVRFCLQFIYKFLVTFLMCVWFFLQVPIILPISVLCVSIYLVIAPIINDPRIEFLYAFIFVISGLVFYVPFVVMKKSLPYTGKYN